MATTPRFLTEAPARRDGSQVLSRYQSFGPSGQIPRDVLDGLLAYATAYRSPTMATVTGWLAVEQACQLSATKAADRLSLATESMGRGLEPDLALIFPDESPDEIYRRQVAYVDLPLYGKLALNHSLTEPDIDENQTRLALLASDAIQSIEKFWENKQTSEAISMEGFLAELIVRMGFNRAPMHNGDGILGFAASSTFRQDHTPFSARTKNKGFERKGNWDVSIFIRQAERDSKIGKSLGYLGQAAIRESGLRIGDMWGVAAKLQIKTRRNAVHTDRPSSSRHASSLVPKQEGWSPDHVLKLRRKTLNTVAEDYDPAQVTTFGLSEDLGLSSSQRRLEIMKLLVSESRNDQLSAEESSQLNVLSRHIKRKILTKLKLLPG